MSKDKPDRRQYRVHCPHCRAPAIARTSLRITDETRQLHFECTDVECGHAFGAVAELRITITHSIRPSAKPAAGVTLLQVPLRRRAAEPVPTPANDPGGPEVPPLAANDDAPVEAIG